MAVRSFYDWLKGDKHFAPTRPIPEWIYMAETVIFRCSDGVDVEADKEVMRSLSGVVRDMLGVVVDTNGGTIPVPFCSREVEDVVSICQINYSLPFVDYDLFSQSVRTVRTPIVDNHRQISRTTLAEAESKFDEDMCKARVLEVLGVAFDSERIRRVHKVAKYLDIKFLQELTETLIMRAPSREFMEMVSPWVDYNSLEAYRSHHVEACRNLEVAVQ